MRVILGFCMLVSLCACAHWHETKAPCTYDARMGCGEWVYSFADPDLLSNAE